MYFKQFHFGILLKRKGGGGRRREKVLSSLFQPQQLLFLILWRILWAPFDFYYFHMPFLYVSHTRFLHFCIAKPAFPHLHAHSPHF